MVADFRKLRRAIDIPCISNKYPRWVSNLCSCKFSSGGSRPSPTACGRDSVCQFTVKRYLKNSDRRPTTADWGGNPRVREPRQAGVDRVIHLRVYGGVRRQAA